MGMGMGMSMSTDMVRIPKPLREETGPFNWRKSVRST